MIQTTLLNYEKDMLIELQHYNYCDSGIICDVVLADKIKKINEVENANCN